MSSTPLAETEEDVFDLTDAVPETERLDSSLQKAKAQLSIKTRRHRPSRSRLRDSLSSTEGEDSLDGKSYSGLLSGSCSPLHVSLRCPSPFSDRHPSSSPARRDRAFTFETVESEKKEERRSSTSLMNPSSPTYPLKRDHVQDLRQKDHTHIRHKNQLQQSQEDSPQLPHTKENSHLQNKDQPCQTDRTDLHKGDHIQLHQGDYTHLRQRDQLQEDHTLLHKWDQFQKDHTLLHKRDHQLQKDHTLLHKRDHQPQEDHTLLHKRDHQPQEDHTLLHKRDHQPQEDHTLLHKRDHQLQEDHTLLHKRDHQPQEDHTPLRKKGRPQSDQTHQDQVQILEDNHSPLRQREYSHSEDESREIGSDEPSSPTVLLDKKTWRRFLDLGLTLRRTYGKVRRERASRHAAETRDPDGARSHSSRSSGPPFVPFSWLSERIRGSGSPKNSGHSPAKSLSEDVESKHDSKKESSQRYQSLYDLSDEGHDECAEPRVVKKKTILSFSSGGRDRTEKQNGVQRDKRDKGQDGDGQKLLTSQSRCKHFDL